MAKRKPIVIGCPQYGTFVRGTYDCDEAGRYRLAPDGTFLLNLVRCGQHGGRCMETLCALHRYNRRGPGTWYPSEILAMQEPPARRRPAGARRGGAARADGNMDVLC